MTKQMEAALKAMQAAQANTVIYPPVNYFKRVMK